LHEVADVDLHLPALLPADYVPDVHERLILYKRIAGAANREALDELRVEIVDRFGRLPEAGHNLFRVTGLRLDCAALGVARIDANTEGGSIRFNDQPYVDMEGLITVVQGEPNVYRFDGTNGLRFSTELTSDQERLEFIEGLLTRLRGQDASSR
jgi:transcription-repair coupling factor (superfamily II helicase)